MWRNIFTTRRRAGEGPDGDQGGAGQGQGDGEQPIPRRLVKRGTLGPGPAREKDVQAIGNEGQEEWDNVEEDFTEHGYNISWTRRYRFINIPAVAPQI